MKATGIAAVGLAGLSTASVPAAGHESVDADATDLLGPIQVAADPDAGFHYPYFLYVPETSQVEPAPMLVEPNNSGTATDDFSVHRTSAREFVRGRTGWTRLFAEALAVPLLVPVFPRPQSDPVDGDHYVHALDEDTMRVESGDLHRVDRQLIAMVDHARGLLGDLSYPVADEVMLNGFSASGNFVNRFTALHPDRVRSVTAGGINGTAILPLDRAKGHTLNYHVGVADLEEITGEPFDAGGWRDVAQFLYLGGEDANDTIPYSDAWNDRQRQIALDVYGEDMQDERMPYCEGVYEDAGADARFEIYDGVGHEIPVTIQRDIVDFHRREGGLKRLSFAANPTAGDESLRFHALVFDDRDAFDLRVRSDERGDLTATPAAVETGKPVDATVALESPVERGETVTAVAVPTGATAPDDAVASVERPATDPPTVRVVDPPSPTDGTITLEYAVGADRETDSQIHVYVELVGGGSRQMVGTFDPGTARRETFAVDPDAFESPLEDGTELRASLVDVDAGESFAEDTAVVGSGDTDGAVPSASVAFDTQPTAGRAEMSVEYAVDGAYEPARFLTLQLRTRGEDDVLLDAVEPGTATTETFSLEKIPLEAGDEIEARIVDEGPVAGERTVVVGDANDEVDLEFTSRPTSADPTATVRYRIDESYRRRDALTLRAYAQGIPGSVPGQPLALLSAGDAGTLTFTVGEDVEQPSGALIGAIVDEEPLALASAADAPENDDSAGETAESGDETPTETGTGDESGGETETPAETDTSTDAETPTDTETPTESGAGPETPTGTGTDSETPTDGEAGAATATETETPTGASAETGSPTETYAGTETPREADAETAAGADEGDAETATATGPGLGVASALASVGGLGYVLKRRLDADGDDEE